MIDVTNLLCTNFIGEFDQNNFLSALMKAIVHIFKDFARTMNKTHSYFYFYNFLCRFEASNQPVCFTDETLFKISELLEYEWKDKIIRSNSKKMRLIVNIQILVKGDKYIR